MSKRAANDELLAKVLASHDPAMQELNFLNTVFGFLSRKTKVLQQPNVSTQINNIVNKHIEKAKQKKKAKKKSKLKEKAAQNDNSDAKEKEAAESQSVSESVGVGTDTTTDPVSTQTETPTSNAQDSKPTEVIETDDVDDNQGEKLIGNGGKTDKYVWTQTLSEVEMKVDIPGDKTGKDCIVDIGDKHLKVSLRGSNDYILNGELNEKVFSDDCSWTLDQEYGKLTKTLTIFLTKSKGMNWWNRVLIGDDEIDTKLIQPENSKLQDLDDDVRGTVEKMMFDQRQKAMGKPTSKELEQASILEKFKAQHPEMDFSNVKFG